MTMNLLYYPPQKTVGERQYGIAPHTDNAMMTFLAQQGVRGLAVRMPSGHWRAPGEHRQSHGPLDQRRISFDQAPRDQQLRRRALFHSGVFWAKRRRGHRGVADVPKSATAHAL